MKEGSKEENKLSLAPTEAPFDVKKTTNFLCKLPVYSILPLLYSFLYQNEDIGETFRVVFAKRDESLRKPTHFL
jgi:hypothetical protein